ncbi:ABC transporter permease [Neisseria leonii]|uniref:Transport permease protein n=1 Tax=Neisseria leonii TaxID=2995413 RepID=A0A9X4E9V0_9NEIS|nr:MULTISPECIES: ABC transporter permease [unclassified Neisseria]MDD9325974.1 ABC transporter permease [Neisseria sp. 3986]MDD9328118.1 ABC transporter permease [Neisseria sp. 51.81]
MTRPLTGFTTLLRKEMLRFGKVWQQTLGAPVLTALLYQLIFAQALGKHVDALPGVSYGVFLIPGLAMMSMMQNAFANASSSLIQSRITGNLVFILLPPISPAAFFTAYAAAGILRGLLVGAGIVAATAWFGLPPPAHPLFIAAFALLGCLLMASLGLITGIWAESFDQLAACQNFLIMPLTFLSGVFYSIQSLPPFWQTVSLANPVFYMIDGFRYGFFGVSDTSPWLSLGIVAAFAAAAGLTAFMLIRSGWKLRG